MKQTFPIMNYLKVFIGTIILHLFILISATDAQHKDQNLGEVQFETSCNAEAGELFEQGLAVLHHMMYDQAIDIFRKAAETDPNCAMAHWGVAMTQLNPLWAPPTESMFNRGLEAIRKAVEIRAPTEREQAYIDALNSYYQTANENGYREGLKAWNHAHEELFKNYPEDVDAGAFYGLSMLATASPDDETFSRQRKAGELMEKLFERAPEHPGLFHYIIHAYDNPVLGEKGVEFAHGYDELAPSVPHALHMPSHIFVRIGEWDETIEWNRRSGEAALRQPVGDYTSMHHAHAMDYMMYGYLQKGQDKKAKKVLDELLAVDNYQPHIGAAYGVAAAQARYVLERRDWSGAADLEPRVHSDFPWDNFPQYEAITWWARGLGAARSGDPASAREAVHKLEELHRQTVENGEDYWALLVDVQRKTVEAWILQEEGREEEALALMQEAADQEDSVDKNPVTPGEVLPARELLGDMLLLHDKPMKALEAYKATLEFSPNRFNSLFGAGKAAEMAGETDLAAQYYEHLIEITGTEESDRPRLRQVAQFLEDN